MIIAIIVFVALIAFLFWPRPDTPDSWYSEDIKGKYHIIETMPDGSERCIGWFIPDHQTHYLTDYYPNSRKEPTTYKPKANHE